MDELKVYMLNGFRISYNGREVALGRNTTAKFIQLLQLIWLYGDEGVTKERLTMTLYEGEDRANLNNSMNNLIYQMRRQMVKAGLPQHDYIIKKGGAYYPDPDVKLILDVDQFTKCYYKGQDAETDEARAEAYLQACEVFGGVLLPELSTEMWVITRNVALQGMFDECMDWLGEYLFREKQFEKAQLLFHNAATIFPDRDWQVGEIESLINQGNFTDAYKLYDKTIRYYEEVLGITATPRLKNCYQLMRAELDLEPDRIDDIRGGMVENRRVLEEDKDGGAYDCSYPSFIDAYHIMSRNMARTGESVFMMLTTLVDYEGKIFRNEEKRQDRSDALSRSIQAALRQGDVFCRYNISQFLILLSGTSREDCDIVFHRIEKRLKDLTGGRAGLKYSVVSLADLEREQFS
ncbi:MAG: hypothetical protein IJP92_05480 [Lachnospiraceae bacterium]|nr:hypothetical protein [Lachnospiraceae bacterium]